MKQRLTFAQFEKLIDWADAQLSGIPHGNSVLLSAGRSRPMTVRDQFAAVFSFFERQGRQGSVRLDPDRFLDYWRDCILALDPPALRSISPKRLQAKGRHAVVLPTLCGPVLRPAVSHFHFHQIVGAPHLSDVRVQRVREGFHRKTVLGTKHRFNPATDNLICHGSADQVRTFIYSQRGRRSDNPTAALYEYLVQILSQPHEWATEYAVLRESSIDHYEDTQGRPGRSSRTPDAKSW